MTDEERLDRVREEIEREPVASMPEGARVEIVLRDLRAIVRLAERRRIARYPEEIEGAPV